MSVSILQAGQGFPTINVSKLGGGSLKPGKPEGNCDWQLIVVYRGKHCPLCTRYLQTLNELVPDFNALGVDVIAVSADSERRAKVQLADVNPDYAVGYDLSIEQMRELGLYISSPRLGMDAERPFAEPGLFIVNEEGNLQMIDISNVPFARPDLKAVLMGIKFYRGLDGEYPINGSYC